MKNKNPRESGMTLVNLITALLIVGILSTIAYANYSGYQQRARRMEAKSALMQIASNQERFYITNHSYTANLNNLGFAGNETDSGLYQLSVPTADNQGFQAVAVPAPGSPQALDTDCQQFTIDSQQTVVATPDPDGKCW